MSPKLTDDPNFQSALEFTLGAEGVTFDNRGAVVKTGYVNSKSDPGGETIWGISRRFLKLIHYKIGNMKDLPLSEAVKIYRQYFWDACKCPALKWPLNICMFDCAVNLGQGDAEDCLRHSDKNYTKFNSWRLGIYNDNVKKGRANRRDLRGWIARVLNLNKYIHITVADSTADQADRSPVDLTGQSAAPASEASATAEQTKPRSASLLS